MESLGAIKPAFGRQFEDSQKQKKKEHAVMSPSAAQLGLAPGEVTCLAVWLVWLVCLAFAESFTAFTACMAAPDTFFSHAILALRLLISSSS